MRQANAAAHYALAPNMNLIAARAMLARAQATFFIKNVVPGALPDDVVITAAVQICLSRLHGARIETLGASLV